MPSFHDVPRGMTGHAVSPSRSGRTDCHTSTYGWPRTRTWAAYGPPAASLDDAVLLGARHEVVDEHAHPAPGPGLELGDRAGEVVDAVEHLDDDALDAQVVAPDLLDELGVVAALDEDPRPARHPGPHALDRSRPGGRARGGLRALRRGRRGRPPSGGSGRPVRRRAGTPDRAGSPWCARAGPRGGRRTCRRPSRPARPHRTSRSATSSTTSPLSASTSRERPRGRHAPVAGEDIGAIAVVHGRRPYAAGGSPPAAAPGCERPLAGEPRRPGNVIDLALVEC